MNTRIALLSLLTVCALAAAGQSQDLPPPPASPDVGPSLGPPPGDVSGGAPAPYGQPSSPPSGYAPQGAAPQPYGAPAAPPGAYVAPPGGYVGPPGGYYAAPPPGAVMVVPDQPYAVYPGYPRHYGRPVPVVLAPPMTSSPWSASIDALFLERSSGGSIPLGYSVYNASSNLPPAFPTDTLYSDDAVFPLAAGVRLELSRKITDNITLSATYWGLQQWSVGNTIAGDPNNFTILAFSPYLQLSSLQNGFDNTLGYTYQSQIENVELNALFRLNTDNPYWRLDWLWGARFVNLCDQFTLTGNDLGYASTENLNYSTTNNLVGVQTGLLFVHGWERFQWETGVKAGLMVNMYRQHGTDTASDPSGVPPGFTPFDITGNGTGLCGLFEVSVAAKVRITDLLWLRLGYQFYDITGLALGPRQLNGFGHGGNVALDGLSIGLQANW